MLDLSAAHLAQVRSLLVKHLPDAEIWAFGSRVSARASEGSDLDLVVHSVDGKAISLIGLREAFRESSLPFIVELLDWATIPDTFRKEILQNYCVIQKGAAGTSARLRG